VRGERDELEADLAWNFRPTGAAREPRGLAAGVPVGAAGTVPCQSLIARERELAARLELQLCCFRGGSRGERCGWQQWLSQRAVRRCLAGLGERAGAGRNEALAAALDLDIITGLYI